MASSDLEERVAAVKEFTNTFKVERIVYVSITVVCLLILLASVAAALLRGKMGLVEVTPMFGSGGAVAFLSGRLIHMWNRSMDVISGATKD